MEYMPCIVDNGEDWGFVDNHGNVICRDFFKGQPTPIIDNVFFVRENNAYSMYQLDGDKPNLLLENIAVFGEPANGLVPICRVDNHIEVVNTLGKQQFILSQIKGQEVSACAPRYTHELLCVETTDKTGQRSWGLVNNEGFMVLAPKYSKIKVLTPDLFLVKNKEKNGSIYQFVNRKGKVLSDYPDLGDDFYITDQYITIKRNGRFFIYNIKGEKIFKCPAKVSQIIDIKDRYFIYENGAEEQGVMDIEGNAVLYCKYASIRFAEDGFIAQKNSNREPQVFRPNGDEVNISYEQVGYANGFGNIAYDGGTYIILDDKFEPTSKQELYAIGYDDYRNTLKTINSQYFDYKEVSEAVKKAIKKFTNEMPLGTKLSKIKQVKSIGVDNFNEYSNSADITIENNFRYGIKAELSFDDHILAPVYKEREVERYDWYYGTYTTTESYVDGYKFNPAASLDHVKILCVVPEERQNKICTEILSMLESIATPQGEDCYANEQYEFCHTIEEGSCIYIYRK